MTTVERRSSGEGCIFKKIHTVTANGKTYKYERYEGRLSRGGNDADGTRVRKSVYGKTRAEVVKKLNLLRGKPSQGRVRSKQTVAQYLNEWAERDFAPDNPHRIEMATYQSRKAAIKHLSSISGMQLSRLSSADVEALIRTLIRKKVGRSAIEKTYIHLKTALGQAVKAGIIAENPLANLESPKAPKALKRILSEAEAIHLVKFATKKGDKYAVLYRLAIETGAREGELFALEGSDLNLTDTPPSISIRSTLKQDDKGKLVRGRTKTEASTRRVPIARSTAGLLAEMAVAKKRPVFTAPDGGHVRKSNFLRRAWHPTIKAAGLPKVTFHSLRNSAATIADAHGVTQKDNQNRLGHASGRMTDFYNQGTDAGQARAAEIMGDVLDAKPKFRVLPLEEMDLWKGFKK